MKLEDILVNVKKMAIAGHVRPDGDCVGSCMGLYNYITENYSDIEVHVYLEEITENFNYIYNVDKIENEVKDKDFDLFMSIDVSDSERIGVAKNEFFATENNINIDHHISNRNFGKVNHVLPGVSSASEVVYDMLDDSKISINTATALYTGIVHDTGVFKYKSTTAHTMCVAGRLIDKGIDFPSIIDKGFYENTYNQNQILGRALLESILILDKKCIFSVVSQEEMEFYGVSTKELGGIVEQLRLTKGVECAILMYESAPMKYKVSLRSKDFIDVNAVASYFGGGGHVMAAGCEMKGTSHDVINNLCRRIEEQLMENEQNV